MNCQSYNVFSKTCLGFHARFFENEENQQKRIKHWSFSKVYFSIFRCKRPNRFAICKTFLRNFLPRGLWKSLWQPKKSLSRFFQNHQPEWRALFPSVFFIFKKSGVRDPKFYLEGYNFDSLLKFWYVGFVAENELWYNDFFNFAFLLRMYFFLCAGLNAGMPSILQVIVLEKSTSLRRRTCETTNIEWNHRPWFVVYRSRRFFKSGRLLGTIFWQMIRAQV